MGGGAIVVHRLARGSYSAAPSGHPPDGSWITTKSRPSHCARLPHIFSGAGGIRTQCPCASCQAEGPGAGFAVALTGAGARPGGPVSVAVTRLIAATAAADAAAPRARRRRRSLTPARSELAARWPIGGSGSVGRPSRSRSDDSSIMLVSGLGPLAWRGGMRVRGGHGVAEQGAQPGQRAGGLALDVSG